MSASVVLWSFLTYARLATASNCDNSSNDDDDVLPGSTVVSGIFFPFSSSTQTPWTIVEQDPNTDVDPGNILTEPNFVTSTQTLVTTIRQSPSNDVVPGNTITEPNFVTSTQTLTTTVRQSPSNICSSRPGQQQDDSGSGLSKAAIAGIVVAIVIALLSVCFLLFCLRRRRARRMADRPDLAAAPSAAAPMHTADIQPSLQMANIAPSPVTADQILSGAKATGTTPAGSLVDPAAATKALPANLSESHASCSSSAQPSSSYVSSNALSQPHTQLPSGPSRASSELHSEMWLHQKDLQLQHRQDELEAADPPPSYEAVANP